jgi:beta-galactosidase
LEGPVPQHFTDNNFCVKGVVTAYRGLTPMAVEIKKVHQFIKSSLNKNELTIRNSYFFRNLDNVQLTWELQEDGKVIEKGTINQLSVAPQQSTVVTFPVKSRQKESKEYFINVHYTLKQAEPFLEKGYEIAYDQFALSSIPVMQDMITARGSLQVNQTETSCTLVGKGFSVNFDLKNGTMGSYIVNGTTVVEQGPQPSYWRAPTDNDIGAGFNRNLRMWRNAYEQGKLLAATVTKQADGSYTILFKKEVVNGDAVSEQQFTVYADGKIKVISSIDAVKGKYPLLLRVGNDLQLKKEFDQISFYGRGPWENYWDRKSASLIGLYKQTVSNQYFSYARPQESGNKADVRWVKMTNKAGKGVEFVYADSLLNFSALPYSLDDLDPETEKKQYHSGELTVKDKIYMHVDLQQTGLQGIDSWGSMPMQQYRIPFADHSYTYWMVPVK